GFSCEVCWVDTAGNRLFHAESAGGPDEPGRAGLGTGAPGVGRVGVGDGAAGAGRAAAADLPAGVGRSAPGSALDTSRGCGATPATRDAAGPGPGSSPTADPVGGSSWSRAAPLPVTTFIAHRTRR
ncbi:hypothetical protein ABZ749_21585, partial [Micromonospora sp. NPDC047753]